MSGLAAHLEQESPTAVHATLCALVRTNATASSAWADYLLDPETAAFFRARLPDAKAAAAALVNSDTNPPSKKRKCDAGPPCSSTEPVVVVCEHCGGPVPEISLRVASLDGTTHDVTVPRRGLVRDVKRLVGQVRGGAGVRRWKCQRLTVCCRST